MVSGRWDRPLPVAHAFLPQDLDLISYIKLIPIARMRRGVRIPAWYLPLQQCSAS